MTINSIRIYVWKIKYKNIISQKNKKGNKKMAISEEKKKEIKDKIKQGQAERKSLTFFVNMLAEACQDDSLFIIKESLKLRGNDDLLTTSLVENKYDKEKLKRIRTFYENINKLFVDIMKEMNIHE